MGRGLADLRDLDPFGSRRGALATERRREGEREHERDRAEQRPSNPLHVGDDNASGSASQGGSGVAGDVEL
jgi:hypothetical protein